MEEEKFLRFNYTLNQAVIRTRITFDLFLISIEKVKIPSGNRVTTGSSFLKRKGGPLMCIYMKRERERLGHNGHEVGMSRWTGRKRGEGRVPVHFIQHPHIPGFTAVKNSRNFFFFFPRLLKKQNGGKRRNNF